MKLSPESKGQAFSMDLLIPPKHSMKPVNGVVAALILVDLKTKLIRVAPLRTLQSKDLLAALYYLLSTLKTLPKTIVTDRQSGFTAEHFVNSISAKGIHLRFEHSSFNTAIIYKLSTGKIIYPQLTDVWFQESRIHDQIDQNPPTFSFGDIKIVDKTENDPISEDDFESDDDDDFSPDFGIHYVRYGQKANQQENHDFEHDDNFDENPPSADVQLDQDQDAHDPTHLPK
eukprot:snap_masked-scaffold_65-processed-gene-0.23-mRNA-1 protein AED:1.00 eAED:1.00 QI:0/0/0/0/1/1/2/0/228